MKLAIRKEPGHIPLSGFHYTVHIFPMDASGNDESAFGLMGYIIVEVSDEEGERLLKEGRAALNHQVEIAMLAEERLQFLKHNG